jgi:hypothetical protein
VFVADDSPPAKCLLKYLANPVGAAIGKMTDHNVFDRDAKLYEEELKLP